jgi:hypothetical protein
VALTLPLPICALILQLTVVATGQTLRRHGDEIERTVGGYYRAHGRVDDTMNLGGIKVRAPYCMSQSDLDTQ